MSAQYNSPVVTEMPAGNQPPSEGLGSLWLALGAFVVAASAFRVRSTDVFWHLASGRWIIENGRIPHQDPFRFTSGDRPWIDHEWLFQILLYGAEALGGMPALIFLRMLWALLLAAVLAITLRRIGTTGPESALLAFVALLGARPRFLLRPELLTFIALGLTFYLVREVATTARASKRILGTLVLLTALWANVHGEALLAPAITGLYLLGCQLHNMAAARKARSTASTAMSSPSLFFPGVKGWRWVFGLPAVLLASLLVNPYGWHLFAVGIGITGALQDLEAYNPEWVPLWVSPQPFMLAGVAAAAAVVVTAWRKARRIHLPTLLPTLFLLTIAATAVRHQALFFVAAAVLAAEHLVLARRAVAQTWKPHPRTATWAWAALCLGAFWCLAPPSQGPLKPRQGRFVVGLGIEQGKFPEKAADFLEAHSEVGPLFNSFAHGGYLLWRLYPPRQIFHEGRMELQPALLREIGEARKGNREWDALMTRYGAVGALVAIDPRLRPSLVWNEATQALELQGHFTANSLLFPQETYALVYWDDEAMLFLDRRLDPPQELLAREFRFVHPEDRRQTLARAAADPQARRQALLEIRRKLSEDPECRRALEIGKALEQIPR